MAGITAFALSQLMSQLTGRDVGFTLRLKPPPSRAKQVFGVYKVLPTDDLIVVKMDMPLLGSFGGCLLGLPADVVLGRLKTTPLDEVLRDAMHEVLNVLSSALVLKNRVVLQSMHTEESLLSGQALDTLKKPLVTSCFDVSMKGYGAGDLRIMSQS
jgi:hypothetical protein